MKRIIIAALVGVLAHAFVPAFEIRDALAEFQNITGSLSITCYGCN